MAMGTPMQKSTIGEWCRTCRARNLPFWFIGLVHRAVDYEPDLLVFYSGGNDAHQPFFYDPRPGYPYNYLVHEAGIRRITTVAGRGMSGWSIGDNLFWLVSQSRLLGRFYHTVFGWDSFLSSSSASDRLLDLGRLRNEAGWMSADWEDKIASSYLNNVEKMCVVGNAHNSEVAVFLQPMVFFKTQLASREKDFIGSDEFGSGILRIYDKMRRGLDHLEQKYRSRCIFADLSWIFVDQSGELFTDYIHINEEGDRMVASRIFRHLDEVNSSVSD